MAELAERRTYKANEYIFVEFSESNEVYLIETGQVKIEMATLNSSDGDLPHITLGANDSLGEIGFVTNKPRAGTALALTDVTVLVWEAQRFRDWCDRHPEEAYFIMRHIANVLAERLSHWQVRVLDSISWGLL